MGFSVAATWMLELAATDFGRGLRVTVGVGGYASFQRLLTAMLVGEHDWADPGYRYTPDPYGRWILGANLLPLFDIDDYETQVEREQAAHALLELARTAGRNGALAGTPVYDQLIARRRKDLTGRVLVAWELLAASSANLVPDPIAGRALAASRAEAAERCHPEFELGDKLQALRVPTILLHGRHDTLVPFSEGLRLGEAIPRKMRRQVVITRLLGHAKSVGAGTPWRPSALTTEIREFVRAIDNLVLGDRVLSPRGADSHVIGYSGDFAPLACIAVNRARQRVACLGWPIARSNQPNVLMRSAASSRHWRSPARDRGGG
jgi:hypothetical protein